MSEIFTVPDRQTWDEAGRDIARLSLAGRLRSETTLVATDDMWFLLDAMTNDFSVKVEGPGVDLSYTRAKARDRSAVGLYVATRGIALPSTMQKESSLPLITYHDPKADYTIRIGAALVDRIQIVPVKEINLRKRATPSFFRRLIVGSL